jgi:tRNA modification GTPase
MYVSVSGRTPPLIIAGNLFLWPDERSYTRQPSAEFHTTGSPPLLAAIVDELCRHGARQAAPGEFTLRAFLGGRIDLTQAEAVMGVVGSRSQAELDGALDQLAGGLSRPLKRLREDLLAVLAELEAGLDFAEEPIEFIGRAELRGRLERGLDLVRATLEQLATRDLPGDLPRIALVGPPNAGKSSLFNALVDRFGAVGGSRSIVSPLPGATRDFVTAVVELGGLACELIDVAGEDVAAVADRIAEAAQHHAAYQRRAADLEVRCTPITGSEIGVQARGTADADAIDVATMADLAPDRAAGSATACSSVTGAGMDVLADEIRRRLAAQIGEGSARSATAARSAGSLREAERALSAAVELLDADGDELVAAEIRIALNAVGEVTGAVCAEDVLDRVFSQFCIGK